MTPSPADKAPRAAAWTTQPERSSPRVLKTMRWIAMTLGRRVARLLLPPIVLYFLAFGGATSTASADYLRRVHGRQPRWRDRYRHVHHFASTILDRVYLLQGRFDLFDFQVSGTDHLEQVLAQGGGAFLIGAHLGSFEALRVLGEHRRGIQVAMLMYEENARMINSTLRAIAPNAQMRVIGLGQVGAMLELRDWLDGGGVAGLLADRTLAAADAEQQRTGTHWIDFLGQPAAFSDGAFRLAALLRRPVVFMTALYAGGNRYEIRFLPLADFSVPAPRGQRQDAVRAALDAYVRLLEAHCREMPDNWFNFFDFWAAPNQPPSTCPGANGMTFSRAFRILFLLLAFASAGVARAQAFDLDALMRTLAQTKSGEATFTEERHVQQLDQTLRSAGKLRFAAPDTFVRETVSPRRERLAVAGNELTITQGSRTRTMLLDSLPEAALVVEAIRGTLTGNRAILERYFAPRMQGRADAWQLDLVPRDPRLQAQVAQLRLVGRQGQVREVRISMADGDSSVMWIEPVAAAAAGATR